MHLMQSVCLSLLICVARLTHHLGVVPVQNSILISWKVNQNWRHISLWDINVHQKINGWTCYMSQSNLMWNFSQPYVSYVISIKESNHILSSALRVHIITVTIISIMIAIKKSNHTLSLAQCHSFWGWESHYSSPCTRARKWSEDGDITLKRK